jgi:hypothetical protein
VATYFLDTDSGLATVLLWGGGVLITVALLSIGMLLVKSDVLLLRVFVAVAVPTLVWGVLALVRDSVSDERVVDAVFGVLIALLSVMLLVRRGSAGRATL